MSWDIALAKEFRKRENPKTIGACIGTVTSVEPFAGNILDGEILLDQSNTYVCNSLLTHERDFNRTGNDTVSGTISINGTVSGGHSESGTISISGSCSAGGTYPSGASYSSSGSVSINGEVGGTCTIENTGTGEGKITLKTILKVGDLVLVLPAADEQSFFIIDIIKGVA